MKKITLFLLLFLITLAANAQTNDSIDFCFEIKKVVTDSASPYFYPSLLEKVKNNPAKIDETDCYYLYYGQIFQPDYIPLMSFFIYPERRDFDMAAINRKYKKVIQLGKIMLERNPVDLTILLHTSRSIAKQKRYIDNDYFSQRFTNLLSAIFSTGNGKTKETAIKIVSMEDDYVLKRVLGFLGNEETLIIEEDHAYSVWTKSNVKLYFEDIMTIEKNSYN